MRVAKLRDFCDFGDDPVEEWVAVSGGIFERATHDLPATLFESGLIHLYAALFHLDASDLAQRHEANRTAFLSYLKDEIGIKSLADRQHLANALARAQRKSDAQAAAGPAKL